VKAFSAADGAGGLALSGIQFEGGRGLGGLQQVGIDQRRLFGFSSPATFCERRKAQLGGFAKRMNVVLREPLQPLQARLCELRSIRSG
jgi:hypothetical protein